MWQSRLVLVATLACGAGALPAGAQCTLGPYYQPPPFSQNYGTVCEVSDSFVALPSSSSMLRTFERVGTDLIPRAVISTSPGGSSIGGFAVTGSTILVGQPSNPSSVRIYDWTGTTWGHTQSLELPPSITDGQFGESVDADGDRAIVAAPNLVTPTATDGAVFVYERSAGVWSRVASVIADVPGAASWFGLRVDLFADRFVATGGSGTAEFARIYERTPGGWIELATLNPPPNGPGTDIAYGSQVALGDGVLFVADNWYQVGGVSAIGCVHVYEDGPGGWSYLETLFDLDPETGKFFGNGLAFEAGDLLVGVPSPGIAQAGNGRVLRFGRADAGWVEVARYQGLEDIPTENYRFGISVALRDGLLVVGSPGLPGPTFGPDPDGGHYDTTISSELRPYCYCAAGSPCANPDPKAGCANSSGVGGRLTVCGSTSVAADDLMLLGRYLLPGQAALLFSGTVAISGGALFGDGLRCAGMNVQRLELRVPDPEGSAHYGPGLIGAAGWSAGDHRFLQIWYRDPVGGPCGSGFNLTNAFEVVLEP